MMIFFVDRIEGFTGNETELRCLWSEIWIGSRSHEILGELHESAEISPLVAGRKKDIDQNESGEQVAVPDLREQSRVVEFLAMMAEVG